jgi:SulP family sulfate permease
VQRTAKQGIRLGVSAPGSTIWRQLLQAGLCEPDNGFQLFSSLDKGVEWCEDQLLDALEPEGRKVEQTLPERLAEIAGDSVGSAGLMKYFERLEVEPGSRLMAEGDPADTLYFVESGQLTAHIVREDGRPIRLQTMGGGHVVGEIGFYIGGQRTADVVADEASVLYRLSLSDLERMQASDPAAASALHRLIAILLAERITYLTAVIEAEAGR